MQRMNVRYIIVSFCLILLLTPAFCFASEETKINLGTNAKSAVLMDSVTGTVIFAKNPDQKLPPASITKIMTLLLVAEAIDRGEIKLTDMVRTSEYAASMGGTQIFLEAGEEMSVEDLLKAVAIASANDASVALAEYISGTEQAFVSKMNARAKELGMHNTNFVNCNGLPAPNHYTSAFDVAIMSKELLRHEWITKYTGIYQDYLRKDSEKPFWLVNTNRLVRFYPGLDGLKTGFTNEAMYCISATAKKDNMRVIAVVMGEPDTKSRNRDITQMLDYAFAQYQSHKFYTKEETVTTVPVDKGSVEKIRVVPARDFGLLVKRGEDVSQYEHEIILNQPIKAPIQKGEVVGKLVIKKDKKVIDQIDLVAGETSEKVKFFSLWLRTFRNLISF